VFGMGLKNGVNYQSNYYKKQFLRAQELVFKDVWHVNKTKSKSFTW
jgi:hypothetical protein